jgi:hypothetical protein
MRQTISTKYHGPTNIRGSRVSAVSVSGHRLTIAWDDALNIDQNHTLVARLLAMRLQWSGDWHGGATREGYVFVNADGDSFTIERNRTVAHN